MSDVEETGGEGQKEEGVRLEGGTYEIIRGRLKTHADEMRQKLNDLNEVRKETFGSIETKLLSTQRVLTENNCVPRDMVPIGKHFLFAYNVHMGLRSETHLEDVFAVYTYGENGFESHDLNLLDNPDFHKHFQDLYKYYKNTTFSKFAVIGPHLFMKFRTGRSVNDFKTFKWLLEEDRITYVDNRSDHEFKYPPQHEFEWTRVRRDWFRMGEHPHVSIEDRVFVETVGGDLTIKVEDNTDTGSGILDEPVDNPDQTLDDAEIFYASVGHVILLKILPYQEKAYRYFVYNEKLQEAHRVDAIEDTCVLLPDSHGLIFPRGYYLLTGELKQFESQLSSMVFEKRVSSPNGEDFLYVFYNRENGLYILLSYNLIEQKVESPIICNGYSIFDNGTLLYFRAEDEASKHHAVQIWQTPYTGPEFVSPSTSESPISHIGNKDIVRAMAECHEVLTLSAKDDTYANLYVDISRKCTDILDSYYWLREDAANGIDAVLRQVGETAQAAIDEYEKVNRIKKATREEIDRVASEADALSKEIGRAALRQVDEFVTFLSKLRTLRGEIISCKERRYVDMPHVEALEEKAKGEADRLSEGCVSFLLDDNALAPYLERVTKQETAVSELKKVADAKELGETLDTTSSDLEMLIEIVSNLKIDDPVKTTQIIDNISAIFSDLNRVKAALKNRIQEMARAEGVAEFNAQMKLLGQSVVNYLDVSDSPDKCESYLTKLTVQIEELEGRFSEFDEFIEQLVEKREEVYNAFEAKRLALVEARNKKASALFSSAERIITGIRNRVSKFEEVNEINGYFAGDLMVEKLRNIIEQLTEMEDTVKADDLQARLKTVREESVRQLKDRNDLYGEGGNTLKLGNHLFSVNVQNLALTVVSRDGDQYYHLAGTDFFEKIDDEEFNSTRDVWDMEILSEDAEVYRSEYLAWRMLQSTETGDPHALEALSASDELEEKVRLYMGPRYTEGYAKGVHDHDTNILLGALLDLHRNLGLLAHPTNARALATLYWYRFCPEDVRSHWLATCKSLATLLELFPQSKASKEHVAELRQLMEQFVQETQLFPETLLDDAATYLFAQLTVGEPFAISQEAGDIYRRFNHYLNHRHYLDKFKAALDELKEQPVKAFQLAREWIRAFREAENMGSAQFEDEAAAIAFCDIYEAKAVSETRCTLDLSGFKGSHAVLQEGHYALDYNQFREKMARYDREVAPRFSRYTQLKKDLAEDFSTQMRLQEFEPRVLTSFVRNQLLDRVYLPLIGDNLAKQMGTAGSQTRTDRMGMLLLISPPGYGKTTLMEYIANRLGLIFMKINGPAIGHEVTSLDPASAPHNAAREELNKLNLSLEMGDNVMIYLDDIQHCNPEFLQKFISLCDAQRKIEGVYKGRTRTYDLRGKKVAVVMAGNPYTESGDKFQIPDMLANRADTYNLGDIIGDNADAFELSYIENSLTSNPVLNKLASRSSKDVLALAQAAKTGSRDGLELEGNYSGEEIAEFINVLEKLFRVRDVILSVNLQYIRSAATEDAYRTEPAFKLQGSYRNMNKITEKVLPIMNEQELETLISSHYENEAQTLTSGAEANLLKFKELSGRMTEEDQQRWEDIKRTFASKQRMHGIDTTDKVGQVVAQLSAFGDGLDAIKAIMNKSLDQQVKLHRHNLKQKQQEEPRKTHTTLAPESLAQMGQMLEPLMEQLGEAVATASAAIPAQTATPAPAPAAPAPPPETLTSRHLANREKELRFLFKVLKQQFEVMHHWVKPIYESSRSQDKNMEDLTGAINNLMATHGSLLNYLQQFQNKRS